MTSRQPAGIPTGGQFATGVQARPTVSLGNPELEVASLRVQRNAAIARSRKPRADQQASVHEINVIEHHMLNTLLGAGATMLDQYIAEMSRQQSDSETVERRSGSLLFRHPDTNERHLAALRRNRVKHHRDRLLRQQVEQAVAADPDASPRSIRGDLRRLAGRRAVQAAMRGAAARHARALSPQPRP